MPDNAKTTLEMFKSLTGLRVKSSTPLGGGIMVVTKDQSAFFVENINGELHVSKQTRSE
jgi:hypothetical protein